MAPQNKRSNVSKVQVPAKKAKVQISEDPEDQISLQLGPILAALSASKDASTVSDLLGAALPHCLAETPANRHSFQTRMLDLTASALKGLEEEASASLKEAENKAESVRTEAALARSEFEVVQKLADAKKEASDAKGGEVEKLDLEVKAVKLLMQTEAQKMEASLEGKAKLGAEQEAFQNVINELWEPLKACKFSNWRKKEKSITEVMEKLLPLSLEASLVEALQVSLKLKLEQRSDFAQRALTCAEEAFDKHKVLFTEQIVATGNQEIACQEASTQAESKLVEVQENQAKEYKEYEDLQNSWAELESKAQEAKIAAAATQDDVQVALEEIESRKSDFDAALGISGAFVALRDPPAPPTVVPEEDAVTEDALAMEGAPSAAVEVDAQAVAVA